MNQNQDPILDSIVHELKSKHRCHTVILYGSRARGLTTKTSDYDVLGIRSRGEAFRIARKQRGYFWDVFVYSEKHLRKLKDQHFSWKNCRVLYEKGTYGTRLARRVAKHVQKPYRPQPKFEIDVIKVWAEKEFERCRMKDIQGLFRRAEFLSALVDHYFFVRQKRFPGPKEGFAWIEQNDVKTFRLIEAALRFPSDLSRLRKAASRVYGILLE